MQIVVGSGSFYKVRQAWNPFYQEWSTLHNFRLTRYVYLPQYCQEPHYVNLVENWVQEKGHELHISWRAFINIESVNYPIFISINQYSQAVPIFHRFSKPVLQTEATKVHPCDLTGQRI